MDLYPTGSQTFSHAVYRIASAFVSLEDTDTIINKAIASLGQACRADRAYVFLFDMEAQTMDNTHEWCAMGVEPQIEMLTDLPLSMFPWWMGKLNNGEMILVPDVSAMGPEAQAEREILETQDVKSVLVLPIYTERILSGFVGMDNVSSPGTWEPEAREYLQVASNMISSTMTRQERTEESLRRTRELEEAYRSLQETQSRLVHAEKLAGIGMLAAGVAHEINNPVGFVKSNTETLRDYVRDIKQMIAAFQWETDQQEITNTWKRLNMDYVLSDVSELIDDNLDGLNRITGIVGNLMSFTRVDQRDKYAPGNLNRIVEQAVSITSGQFKNIGTFKLNLGEVPETICNETELNQALVNILINAVQAIGEQNQSNGGVVTIETGRQDDSVYCTVTDNGPGISDDAMGRVFEPFFTTKEVGKGTGLGLSIVYDTVVNKHGGQITAENGPDGGACFTLRIPIKAGQR